MGTYGAKYATPRRTKALLGPKEWRRFQCSKRSWIQALMEWWRF